MNRLQMGFVAIKKIARRFRLCDRWGISAFRAQCDTSNQRSVQPRPHAFHPTQRKTLLMFKNKLLLLMAGACLGLPLEATTIFNTYPDGPANYTNAFVLEAQTFTAPADPVLSSFEFRMASAEGQSVQLEIYQWGAFGPAATPLYTSAAMARINAPQGFQDFLVSNINLSLTPGDLYGAVLDSGGYASFNAAFNGNQNSYTGGKLWLLSQNATNWSAPYPYNVVFQATFQPAGDSPVPEPAAFLLMGAGLATLALLRRRRSRLHS